MLLAGVAQILSAQWAISLETRELFKGADRRDLREQYLAADIFMVCIFFYSLFLFSS
jgi:hypothetical protein